ncbi:MAG: hypothetical protein EOP48_15145 [Sphingobacteriales bacterium]|nr:MAG: hypothetical protein EOP48_15145 [Sphingobacteriales bacterium]
MTDDLDRLTLKFPQRISIESAENYYRAVDGWWIEKIDGEWTFCANDPGLSSKDIRVKVTEEDFEYAKQSNPTFNEMADYMKSKGRI